MRIAPRLAICAALLLASGPARASEQTLTIDAATTEIAFVLGATLHSAEGSVKVEKGAITFDPDTGAATGEVVIDATSASTGLARRDRNMHADVLESARFPKIVFRPERIDVTHRGAASADVELRGTLDMHGERHPLVLPAGLVQKNGHLAIDARFRVPYVDWGMRDVSNLILRVDRFVDVTVHAGGTLAAP